MPFDSRSLAQRVHPIVNISGNSKAAKAQEGCTAIQEEEE
jgi:hypothetical protein